MNRPLVTLSAVWIALSVGLAFCVGYLIARRYGQGGDGGQPAPSGGPIVTPTNGATRGFIVGEQDSPLWDRLIVLN
jgi:hypothetical protein